MVSQTDSEFHPKPTIRSYFLSVSVVLAMFFIGWAAAPGYMNEDTLDMYTQAVTGHFHDWHSPMVSEIWYIFGANPWILNLSLSVTLLAFAFFTYGIYRQMAFSHDASCVLTIITAYTPPVLAFLGSLLKDTWVAVLLLGALWLSMKFYEKGGYLWLFIRAILSVLAVLVRPDFLIILSLFFVLELLNFERFPLKSRLYHLLISFSVTLVAYFSLNWLIHTAGKVEHAYPEQFIYLSDLADLSVVENKMLIPDAFLAGNNLDTLKRHYSVTDMYTLFWTEPAAEMLQFSRKTEDIQELRKAWLSGLFRRPDRYLIHRFEYLYAYLQRAHGHGSVIVANPYHLAPYHAHANGLLTEYQDFNTHNLYQRHLISCVGCLLLAVFIIKRKRSLTSAKWLLAISLFCGFVYQILFSALGVSPAYRLGYAGVIVFWIGLYAILAEAIIPRMVAGIFNSSSERPSEELGL